MVPSESPDFVPKLPFSFIQGFRRVTVLILAMTFALPACTSFRVERLRRRALRSAAEHLPPLIFTPEEPGEESNSNQGCPKEEGNESSDPDQGLDELSNSEGEAPANPKRENKNDG